MDHEQRRRQIAEAVWRIASRSGLEDVTMRRVATEAGVSMRLVQYYFGTRDDLLLKSLEILNKMAEGRAQEKIRATIGEPTPRNILRGIMTEMLPYDDDRRTMYLVHIAYFVKALTDDSLGAALRNVEPLLEEFMASLIRQAQEAGEVPASVDPMREATLMMCSVDGMQTAMLLGQRTEKQTHELIDYQLDRIFSTRA